MSLTEEIVLHNLTPSAKQLMFEHYESFSTYLYVACEPCYINGTTFIVKSCLFFVDVIQVNLFLEIK